MKGHLKIENLGHSYFSNTNKYAGKLHQISSEECFAVVRNPYSWLFSYYSHEEENKTKGWGRCNEIHNFTSFNDFLIAYCNPDFVWHCPMLHNFMLSQLYGNNDKCVPKKIIYQENLFEGIKELFPNLSLINYKPLGTEYKQYYNNRRTEMVAIKCRYELELLNYNFDNSNLSGPFVDMPENHRYSVINNRHYEV